MPKLSDFVVKELSVNGRPVEHFFDCFGSETLSLGDAVEYSMGGHLFQIFVDDKVVITTEEPSGDA